MEIKLGLESVSPHTVAVSSIPGGNCAGIALNEFVIAIDSTMFPKTGTNLREKLEKKFGLPVKFLFVTHSHGDHVFGMKAFKDTTIIGSSKLASVMVENVKTRWTPEALDEWKKENPEIAPLLEEVEIVFPSVGFETKLEIIDGDLKLELYQSGGHTACSSYAYFPYEKVLFSGDLIFAKTFPYASDPSCNPDLWIQTLEHFLTLDVEKFVNGHGPVVDRTEIEKHLTFFKDFRDRIKKAIAAGESTDTIQMPDFYEDESGKRKKTALEHWYTFYQKKFRK
ncbi:MAG: MBL fold metallo-hydrolase [Promethearchaeota archaeon]